MLPDQSRLLAGDSLLRYRFVQRPQSLSGGQSGNVALQARHICAANPCPIAHSEDAR
jgi:hypothetical protein